MEKGQSPKSMSQSALKWAKEDLQGFIGCQATEWSWGRKEEREETTVTGSPASLDKTSPNQSPRYELFLELFSRNC
jgi:hypothetical protein